MKKLSTLASSLILVFWVGAALALTCPDPNTTSLKWGVPPKPWVENPYSANTPQGEDNTQFVKANILVSGYGKGVVCTYKNSVGDYSIWWQVPTKIPPRTEMYWIDILGGFVCSEGIAQCQFYTHAP